MPVTSAISVATFSSVDLLRKGNLLLLDLCTLEY